MTKNAFSIDTIQHAVHNTADIDGWLIYNYRKSNPFAYEMLHLAPNEHITRRFFYWIPKTGKPIKIVHAIEPQIVQHLPGEELIYASWKELEETLARVLAGKKKVAMEYSPMNHIPTLSRLDAGTVEWLAHLGVSVVSSWPILEQWLSRWDQEQLAWHKEAALVLDKAFKSSFRLIKESLDANTPITELHVQEHILKIFHEERCSSSHTPICAVNAHAALPHYTPTAESNQVIQRGDLILIDMWCKKQHPRAPYADFTQMALASHVQNESYAKTYDIVLQAQKKAIAFIQDRLKSKQDIYGYEVDDVTREHIASFSLDHYFTHRTGHNIHTLVHGHGTHLDNFETHDTRRLMPRTCFSIEPGIYLPGEYGIRLESNAFITQDLQLEITGPVADTLPLLW